MKFTQSQIYPELTVGIVAHNLVDLHYPFIESFWSALQLGCRFLVGDFGSTDRTRWFFERLAQYAPVEIIGGRWQVEHGPRAIGIATQALLDRCPTTHLYNLQACEILDDDFMDRLMHLWRADKPEGANRMACAMPSFNHFWGNMSFDGLKTGNAYGSAQRLLGKGQRIDHFDGCNPEPHGGYEVGRVFRYSYCFRNQIARKVPTNMKLYGVDPRLIPQRLRSFDDLRRNPNYDGHHPSFVQHLIGVEDYDADRSLAVMAGRVEKM